MISTVELAILCLMSGAMLFSSRQNRKGAEEAEDETERIKNLRIYLGGTAAQAFPTMSHDGRQRSSGQPGNAFGSAPLSLAESDDLRKKFDTSIVVLKERPDGATITINAKGIIVEACPSVSALLGFEKNTIEGKEAASFIDDPSLREYLEKGLQGGRICAVHRYRKLLVQNGTGRTSREFDVLLDKEDQYITMRIFNPADPRPPLTQQQGEDGERKYP